MAPANVARRKQLVNAGGIATREIGRSLDVAALVFVHTKGIQHGLHRRDKAHGQEHQISLDDLLGAGNFGHLAVLPLQAHRLHGSQLALFANEFFGADGEFTLAALFVAGRGAHLQRPVRPHQWLVFLLRRHGHQLQLGHTHRTVAVGGAHAVRAGVATANDHHVLAISANLAFEFAVARHLVLLGQKLHRKVHALEFAAGHRQIARLLGTAGQQHGIKLGHQRFRGDGFGGPVGDLAVSTQAIFARHQHAGANLQAFGHQLRHTAVDVGLVQLEVRNAVAQQTAHLVILLKQGHVMPGAHQLLGSRQTCGARAHHSYFFARHRLGGLRFDPAFIPGTVNDGVLNRLDANGRIVNVGHTGGFARCGADAARELGEVVGAVQHLDGIGPIALIDQIVEVWNDVVDGAAVVAKRGAAIHAAGTLNLGLLRRQGDDELFVVLQALGDRQIAFFDALVFHKTGGLSHGVYSFNLCSRAVQVAGWAAPPSEALWIYLAATASF